MGIDIERVVHASALLDIVELTCPICEDLLSHEEAVETPCGHLFCRTCVSPFIQSQSECPQDRSPVNITQLKSVKDSNPFVYRMLGRSLVRCERHGDGCAWSGELSEAASHSSLCKCAGEVTNEASNSGESADASSHRSRSRERGSEICSSCDEKSMEIGMLRSDVDQKIIENGDLMLRLAESLKENEEKSRKIAQLQLEMNKIKEQQQEAAGKWKVKSASVRETIVSQSRVEVVKDEEVTQVSQPQRHVAIAMGGFRVVQKDNPPSPLPLRQPASQAVAAHGGKPTTEEVAACQMRRVQFETSIDRFRSTLFHLSETVTYPLLPLHLTSSDSRNKRVMASETSVLHHIADLLRANANKKPFGNHIQDLFLCMQRHYTAGFHRRDGILPADYFGLHRQGWTALLGAAHRFGSTWFTEKQMTRIRLWHREMELFEQSTRCADACKQAAARLSESS